MKLAQRVSRIKPSPTLAITAKAAALRAEGKNIIGFGAGEPDFNTPDHIKKAAIEAIHDNQTRYTAVAGIVSLREAVSDKLLRDNGISYSAEQILVSTGAKQGLYNLTQAVLGKGDEAIIPAPYWVSYPDMVRLADADPVYIKCDIDQGFKMSAEQLEAAITPRTRLLFLNSPSNPSGATYTEAELQALGSVLKKHPGILIASDDIYEHIQLSDQGFCNILMACPELAERTLLFNGVSKAYAMTGWRIGYAAGPLPVITAMKNIQSQSTSNPTSIAQVAAEAALRGDQTCIQTMNKAFRQRHQVVVDRLNAMPGVRCLQADGAFYAFAEVSEVIDGMPDIVDDIALGEYLLNEAGVAIVPGTAFGMPGYMRLSFATSMELIREGLDRIESALGSKI